MNFDSLQEAFDCIKKRGDYRQQLLKNQEAELLRLQIPIRIQELKKEFYEEPINLVFVGVRGSGKTYLIHKLMKINQNIKPTTQTTQYRLDQLVNVDNALKIQKQVIIYDTQGFEIGNQQHNNNLLEQIQKIKGELILIWVRNPQTYYVDEEILQQRLTDSSILLSSNSLASIFSKLDDIGQIDFSMTYSWNSIQSQSLQSKAIIVINQFQPDFQTYETDQTLFKIGYGEQVYDFPIFEKYLLQQINFIYCKSFYSENYIYLYYKIARYDTLHAQAKQITNVQNHIKTDHIKKDLQIMNQDITNYIKHYSYQEENFKLFFYVENKILLGSNDVNKIQLAIDKYIQASRLQMVQTIEVYQSRLLEKTMNIISQLATQVGSSEQMQASFSMVDMAGFSLEIYPYKLVLNIVESFQQVFKLNQFCQEVNIKKNGFVNILSSLKSMMSMVTRKPKSNIIQIRDLFVQEYIDIQVLKMNLHCCNQSLIQQFEQIKQLYIEILHKVTFALKIFIDEIQSYS